MAAVLPVDLGDTVLASAAGEELSALTMIRYDSYVKLDVQAAARRREVLAQAQGLSAGDEAAPDASVAAAGHPTHAPSPLAPSTGAPPRQRRRSRRFDPVEFARRATLAQALTFSGRGAAKSAGYAYGAQLAVRMVPALLKAIVRTVRLVPGLLGLGSASASLRGLAGLWASVLRVAGKVCANSLPQARVSAFLGVLVGAVRLIVLAARRKHGVTRREWLATEGGPANARGRGRGASDVVSVPGTVSASGGVSSGQDAPPSPRGTPRKPPRRPGTIRHSTVATLAAVGTGIAAGASLLLVPSDTRAAVSWFVAVRAMEAAAQQGCQAGVLPRLSNGHVLLMAAASAEIVWAIVRSPHTLDASYQKFLKPYIGLPDAVPALLRDSFDEGFDWSTVVACPDLQGKPVPASMPGIKDVTCAMLHPGRGCTSHFLHHLQAAFLSALKLYIPVHAVPLLAFRRALLVSAPASTLLHMCIGIARSSTFLSLYAAGAWAVMCATHQVFSIHSKYMLLLCGAIGGSAVTVEKGGRRVELALYTFGQAAKSWLRRLNEAGVNVMIPGGELLSFGVATLVLVRAFLTNPSVLRGSYSRLIALVVGD